MIDNSFSLIGKVISPIKEIKVGNYSSNYMEVEVNTGSTQSKNNVIFVKLRPKDLDDNQLGVGSDLTGSTIAVNGILVGTIYNGKNYINVETKEFKILIKKVANGYNSNAYANQEQFSTPRYTPENNYGLGGNDDDDDIYDITGSDLPF